MTTNTIPKHKFYVYGHYRKDTNTLFYVGKGQKRRAWDCANRNQHWKNIVAKHGHFVFIFYSGISEEEAFKSEIALITDLKPEANYSPGGKGGGIATYGFLGKKHTEERNRKLSLKTKGKANRPTTDEDRKRLREFALSKRKPVVDLSTGISYGGIREAARALGIAKTSVIKRIKAGKMRLV